MSVYISIVYPVHCCIRRYLGRTYPGTALIAFKLLLAPSSAEQHGRRPDHRALAGGWLRPVLHRLPAHRRGRSSRVPNTTAGIRCWHSLRSIDHTLPRPPIHTHVGTPILYSWHTPT